MRKVFPVLFTFLILLSTLQYNVSADDKYESVSAFVKMQKRDLKVMVYYYKGNEKWAKEALDLSIRVLPIIEEVAGFPYPHVYDVRIYEVTWEETGGWGGSYGGERGILITPTENWNGDLIHEHTHAWTQTYDRQWLGEGFARFYTHLVFEKLHRKRQVNRTIQDVYNTMKTSDWFLDKNFYTSPKPKNWTEEDEKRKDFCYNKSFVFVYRIYGNFGLNTIQNINYYLYSNNIKADSKKYKELLEKYTGDDLDDFFSGWVFEGEYKKSKLEKEIEDNIQKVKGNLNILRNTAKKYGLSINISNLDIDDAEKAYKEYDLKTAQMLINRTSREIEYHLSKFEQYAKTYDEKKRLYENKNFIFVNNPAKTKLENARSDLSNLRYEQFIKDLEEFDKELVILEESYPEMIKKCNEIEDILKSLRVEGVFFSDVIDTKRYIGSREYKDDIERFELIKMSLEKYKEARKKWKEKDMITEIGLTSNSSPVSQQDLEKAKYHIDHGYFEKSLEFSNYVLSTLESARNIGLLVVAGASIFLIIIIIVVFIVVRKLISKKGKVGQ